MEEKAIRGVPWTMFSYASTKLVSVLTLLALARLLSPADFGVMAVAQIAVSFLNWFAGLSFAGTLVVRQDLDTRGRGTILTITMITTTTTALIAVALAPLVAELFHQPRVAGVLTGFAAVLVIGGLGNFYEAVLQRNMQFRKRFIALAAQAFSTAAVSITLAVLGAGVWSLVIGQLVGNSIFALLLFVFAAERIRPAFEREVLGSIIRTGRGFFAQGVTAFIRGNTDSVMVGRLLGTTSLGYYSMAARLGDQTYWAIADPVAHVTFPSFARSRAQGEDFRSSFLSVLRLVALVGCFAGVTLSGAAEPLTRALFGPRWLPMIGVLWIIGIWAAVRPIDATMSWLLNSVQRAGVVGWVSLVILVPLVPGFVLAAHFGTMTAFACVTLMDTILSFLILSGLACHYVELRPRDLWRSLRPVLLACPPAWLAMFACGHMLKPVLAIVALLASVSAGVVVYAVMLWILEPGFPSQVRAQVLRMFGRGAVPGGLEHQSDLLGPERTAADSG